MRLLYATAYLRYLYLVGRGYAIPSFRYYSNSQKGSPAEFGCIL